MKQNRSIRARLITLTSTTILVLLLLFSSLLFVFIKYYSKTIEKIYGIDDDILNPILSVLFYILVIIVVIALLVSVLGGYLITGRLLATISSFTIQIKEIKSKGVEQRMEVEGNDELSELGNEFNSFMDEIEVSLRQQSQFVTDTSHELKTPLAILKSNLEMLQRWGKEDKEVLETALKVELQEVNRMISLVEEMLQLTRNIDVEKLEISPISISVNTYQVIKEFELLYPEMQIHVSIESENEISMRYEHFHQLLLILLDNAVKYSKENSNLIEVTYSDYKLHVKDYGIGIDDGHKELLFDRFFRVDESRENKGHSFGLGLAIAKRLCDLYGYHMEIESELGKYTIFTIVFKEEN